MRYSSYIVHLPLVQHAQHIWKRLLDACFPRSFREERVRALSAASLSPILHMRIVNDVTIVSVLPYTNTVRDVVWALKYRQLPEAATLLATIIADAAIEHSADTHHFSEQPLCIVPVPLGAERLRTRGYNQAALLARGLRKHMPHATVRTDLLIRTRETKPQTTLRRDERLRNVAGAFDLTPGVHVKDMRILLIDDVSTTGATLAAAAQPLQRAGAAVDAYSAAYVPPR